MDIMDITEAESIRDELRDFHANKIVGLLNSGSFAVGSAYSITSKNSDVDRIEFEVRPIGTATHVHAMRQRPINGKWSVKIYPSAGGEPFRIEDHGTDNFAHVNTSDPRYDHTPLDIPQGNLDSYGAVGSALGGHYDTNHQESIPSLIKKHFDNISR